MFYIIFKFYGIVTLLYGFVRAISDGCTCSANKIICDGQNKITEFPPSLQNASFCSLMTAGETQQLIVQKYLFTSISNHAIELVSDASVQLIIKSNSQLQDIDSNAFASIRANISSLQFFANALPEIPLEALLSLNYYNTCSPQSGFTIRFERNHFIDLPKKLSFLFEKISCSFRAIGFAYNSIESIPALVFAGITVNTLDLSNNPIVQIEDAAFFNVTISNLLLSLAGKQSYQMQIIKHSDIDKIEFKSTDEMEWFDINQMQCFQQAPQLCAKSELIMRCPCLDLVQALDGCDEAPIKVSVSLCKDSLKGLIFISASNRLLI